MKVSNICKAMSNLACHNLSYSEDNEWLDI